MITYQKRNFLSLLEKFKEQQLRQAQEKEDKYNKWREAFVLNYSRESIISMEMKDYLIGYKSAGAYKSFCGEICSDLKTLFHINVSDKIRQETFGITLKYGTQLTLSKDLENQFGKAYDKAFAYIKNEIITLLDEVDKKNYAAVESSKLSYDMKYILLIIYCPDKFLPICNRSLLLRYCETVGIACDDYKEMIYLNNLLLQWKEDVPELANWSYSIFTSFCDWLYRNNRTIAGNLLRQSTISAVAITEEINDLKLQGKSKEAIVKVRVNQGIFRERLLQRYKTCCLCGAGINNLLVASHIKPWSVCEPEEKLDIDNGFMFCPNHDRLFDQGWISFDDDGEIIIAEKLLKNDKIVFNVRNDMRIPLTEKNRIYLQYHREHIFDKKIL